MARAPTGTDHVRTLDGLRGIAVLLVLWEHTGSATGLVAAVKRRMDPGFVGVDLFFVLSGFLITRILLSDKARGMRLRSFLVRRFLRIFPIYYLTIAAVALYAPGAYLLYCLGYLGNFYFAYHPEHLPLHHTWSLSVEEHFYLLWPLAVYRLPFPAARRLARWGILPSAVICALLLWRFGGPVTGHQLIYMSTMTRAGSLALGASFAFDEERIRGDGRYALRLAGALAVVAALMVPASLAVRDAGKLLCLLVFHGATSGLGVLATVRLAGAEARWPLLSRALGDGFLPFVGRISYGLYIYHYPIYTAFGLTSEDPRVHPTLVDQLLAVTLTAAAALVSFYVVERPLLRYKDRFRDRAPAPAPARASAEVPGVAAR
jgi:peptidoglycan/LPS O-acetylase OafA/YrhL